jgi:uncharacterized membrane protein YbhN (UPF0104 family)
LGGLALAAWLIRGVGVARVLAVFSETWRWVPVVALLEVLFVSMDIVSLRCLLGEAARRVPWTAWVRSTAIAYASTILLPTSRAAGEAGRSAILSPTLGAADAITMCTRLEACGLFGNGVVSLLIVTVLLVGRVESSPLQLLLLGNAALCAAGATAILVLLASGSFSEWLKRRLRRFEAKEHKGDLRPRGRQVAVAILSSVVGRLFQTVQYGVALHAVGGHTTTVTAFTTQGAHLVGAALGSFVPGQIGVAEAVYRTFATTVGLGADPARALTIALVARVAQIGLAVVCLATAAAVQVEGERPSD